MAIRVRFDNLIIDQKIIKSVDKFKQKYLLRLFRTSLFQNEYIKKLNDISNNTSQNTSHNTSQNNYKSLFNNDNNNDNYKFDYISKLICDKNIINNIKNILDKYFRYFKHDAKLGIKINHRQILLAWLIYNCYKQIFDEIDTKEKYHLLEYSKKLIDEFNKLLYFPINKKYDMNNFNKIILNYTNYIIIYLEKDKIDKLNYFTKEWICLEKTKDLILKSNKYDNIQKDEIIKNFERDKKLIEKYIKIFSKNVDYDRLKIIINISQQLSKKIIENYKLILKNDLDNLDFDKFSTILNEIKKFILLFNDKLKDEIDERVDIYFFIQLIRTDSLTINDVINFGDYIISHISKFGSIALEEENNKKWNEIKLIQTELTQTELTQTELTQTELNNSEKIKNFISILIIFILEIIENIKNELYDYKLLLDFIYK